MPSGKIHQRQRASLLLGQRLARSMQLRDQFLTHHDDADQNMQKNLYVMGPGCGLAAIGTP